MTFSVRRATTDDASGIAGVHVAAWQVAYRGLIPQGHLDQIDLGERTEQWRSLLEGKAATAEIPPPVMFVAEDSAVVVGFACVGRYRDEPCQEALGELWAMYVAPESWGNEVGDALMAATLEELDRLNSSMQLRP